MDFFTYNFPMIFIVFFIINMGFQNALLQKDQFLDIARSG